MSYAYDAIVVGGGVNGGAIAYNLSKRGKKVLLLEKDVVVSKSSSAAAGMLGAQAELEEDGPLFQLARKSRAMFGSLEREIRTLCGIDIELINKGMYKVAQTIQEEMTFKNIIDMQNRVGEEAEWLSGNEVRVKESSLSDAVIGAMYIPKDGHVSAPQLAMGFIKSAAALGAVIKEYVDVYSLKIINGKIQGVQTNEGDFYSDSVIVAGGAWSKKLLDQAEVHLDMYPVKGECFSVTTHRPLLTSTIFSHGCYLVPKKGGRLIVGATVKPYTFNQAVTIDGISSLMEKAKNLVPSIINAQWEKAWAGIRPQTGDGFPYLGEHPEVKGLFIATGHFRNGILLAPITGEMIADLVERKICDENQQYFSINRSIKMPI